MLCSSSDSTVSLCTCVLPLNLATLYLNLLRLLMWINSFTEEWRSGVDRANVKQDEVPNATRNSDLISKNVGLDYPSILIKSFNWKISSVAGHGWLMDSNQRLRSSLNFKSPQRKRWKIASNRGLVSITLLVKPYERLVWDPGQAQRYESTNAGM